MAALSEIKIKANSLADIIAKRVAANAPVKTGRLRDALIKENNINTMLEVQGANSKVMPISSLTFSINYAPLAAPYGKWWNDPTISQTVRKAKTKNKNKINFVNKAFEENKVKDAFAALEDLIGDLTADGFIAMLSSEIDKEES